MYVQVHGSAHEDQKRALTESGASSLLNIKCSQRSLLPWCSPYEAGSPGFLLPATVCHICVQPSAVKNTAVGGRGPVSVKHNGSSWNG